MPDVRNELFEPITRLRVLGFDPMEIADHSAMKFVCEKWEIPQEDIYSTVEYYMRELDDPKNLSILRLEKAIKSTLEILGDDGKATRLNAARVLTSLIERHSRLLGLDSPVKIDQTNQEVRYSIEGLDPKEITDGT